MAGIRGEGEVWISEGLLTTYSSKPLMTRQSKENLSRSAEAVTLNQRGAPLPRERFPEEAWGDEDAAATIERLPHMFSVRGFPTVSSEVAAIMRDFDLGQGALYPIDIYQRNRKRLIGTFHCLNIGNVKDTFLPEHSPTAKPMRSFRKPKPGDPPRPVKFEGPSKTSKGDMTLTADALQGPDLWLEAKVNKMLFLSGPLARAIRKARVERGFRMRACTVVEAVTVDHPTPA